MDDPAGTTPSTPLPRGPRTWAVALAGLAVVVVVAIPMMGSLSCLLLAGFALVQWFSQSNAGWSHLGWFAFGLSMSAAPWMTPNRGNGWAMLCMTAMGFGGLAFAWQRYARAGPLACKPDEALCRIAESVRLALGDSALAAIVGLAGLSLVIGGLRYAFWDRPRD